MNAKDILEKYWDGSIPVGPISIADMMGIKVFRWSVLQESANVSDIDGKITINVSSADTNIQQRFSIAHALGHYALGHLVPGEVMYDTHSCYLSDVVDVREYRANIFAIDLLIPDDALRVAVKKNRQVSSLAETFWVSQRAMSFQLGRLGMLRG